MTWTCPECGHVAGQSNYTIGHIRRVEEGCAAGETYVSIANDLGVTKGVVAGIAFRLKRGAYRSALRQPNNYDETV